MIRQIFAGLLISSLSIAAQAADGGAKGGAKHSSGSEFFYQAGAGQQDVTPSLGIYSTTMEFDSGGDLDSNLNILGVEYERGLTDQLSVGGAWNYVFSGEVGAGTTENDYTGFTNLRAFVKGSMPISVGALKFGAELSISPWDSEIDSDGDQNAVSGGHSFTPYFGYETDLQGNTVGARLQTEIELTERDQKDKEDGTTSDISGGEPTTFSFFFERALASNMTFGVSFDWTTYSDIEIETGGSTVKSEMLTPQQMFTFYLPTAVGPGMLLPELQWGFSTDDDIKYNGTKTDIDSYRVFNLIVGYRMPF